MDNLISVITPCLNGENYIEECLNSVTSQTKDLNIEFIVVDGGSTDNTVDILKSRTDIKWLSEKDSGQSDAYNKGIKMAKGDWIILLDGDDILLPGTLKLYLSEIKRNKDVDIIYGHTQFIDAKSKHIRYVISTPFRYEYLIYGLAMPPSSGLLYRAELLKNNLMDINHHFNLDTEWYFRCGLGLNAKLVNNFTIGFRFWGQNKTSPLFEGSAVPEPIIKERKVLKEKYKDPFIANLSNIRKKVNPLLFKIIYYLDKINNYCYLLLTKKLKE